MKSQLRFKQAISHISTDDQKKPQQDQSVSFVELFRFAQGTDYLFLALGAIFAMVAGCSFPWFAFLWGRILDSFLYASDPTQRLNNAIYYRNIFFYVGVGALVSSWIAFASWTILSQRMAVRCRKAYMKSLLRQDVGWFDTQNQFQLSSNFSTDSLAYQKATGEKIGSMFNLFAMFVCGAAIALAIRWTMALVILGSLPIIGIGIIIFIYLVHKRNSTFLEMYEQADVTSHQALNSIKTVKALNGQPFEQKKYSSFLQVLKQKVPKWALLAGIGTGLFFFIQYCAFSFGFWYGTHCVAGTYRCSTSVTGSVYTPGDATIVFFAIFVGSFNFMQLVPNIMAILDGMKAAKRLYKIIDQKPTIGHQINQSTKGIKKDQLKGHIIFQNVSFSYPKNKSSKVLKQLNLQITAGQDIAFVGDSGCGKSTIIQLIMRFYDPDEGKIILDGIDLKDYDLQWLRSQIGYVGQQPCLFEGTVLENLRIGKDNASIEEVRQALSLAEALEFVDHLSGGLNYNVGYAGSQLSGGQKQRIAIARALIRKPKILILDQATSALDRRNEKLIQATLDKASKGITTLTIAHRVKTIMNCDQIYVLNAGKVVESGKFNKLARFQELEIDLHEDDVEEKNLQLRQTKIKVRRMQTQKQELGKTQLAIDKQQYTGSVYGRLFSYTQGNRCYFFIAIICSLVAGAIHPCSAFFLANILNQQFNLYPFSIINTSDLTVSNDVSNAEKYVLGLFGAAIFIFFPFTIQSLLFTIVGESVTEKLRKQVYHKLLRLPVQWFQSKRNRGGAAATRFGVDSRQVNSLVTSLVSTMLMSFSAITIGIIIAFVFCWQLGCVGLIAMPSMVAAGLISMLFYGGFGDQNKPYYQQSSKISEEAILNIRTVYSCGYQRRLGEIYDQKLQYPLDAALMKGTKLGVLYGLSQLILEFTFGCLFYFGALIMRDNPDVQLLNIFYAIMAIAWAGWYAGNNFYFMPDVVSGKESAKNLFKVLDEQDEDQLQIKYNSQRLTKPIQGNIEFINVSFSYRALDDPVLSCLNLQIKKGDKIAFVGPSGCGKSTLFQLMQRFYDFDGEIIVDGVQLRDYDIHHLRQHFVAVNQEPSLFTGTIGNNIKYNLQANQAQLIQAATNAQAITFINSNQAKFDKEVGVLGSQLSGGQKQRIAIARALLRKPQILMLDEATSALDRPTEKKAQQNIDNVMEGKTSLVVAHRIETIMNSDRIYLFDKGDILQQGSYNELMEKKRYFYNLQRGQQLKE